MVKLILISLGLISSCRVYAQVNYVLNPDFEQHAFCPNNNDQIRAATYWTGVDSIGFNTCVPDYCNACAPYGTINSVPFCSYYWQYPHSGNGMVKMQMYYDESDTSYHIYRDYLQGKFYKNLKVGQSYCVSFYVNNTEYSRYAIKEISAYFDNGSIDTTKQCGSPQIQYSPQITNSGGVITDTMNWTKIEGSFIANGESHITIGNFKDKAHTTVVQFPINQYNRSSPLHSVYLIDDVSVIESDLPADASADKLVVIGDSIYIGRPKEVGLECTWSILGNSAIIGNGAGIWVKPNITTSYVVTQILCGNVKKDTVEVQVLPVGIKSATGHAQQYSLSPNPSSGLLQIMQSVNDSKPISLSIYEPSGKKIYSNRIVFDHGKCTQDLSFLAQGIYYINLIDSDGSASMLHFIKQ